MHIPCPPPSRSTRPTAQIKVFVRQWHEQIEKNSSKSWLFILRYFTHQTIENINKGGEKVEAVRRRGNKAVMCLEVGKTMGGVIRAAPPLQMRQFGRFLDSSLRVVRR